jgi:hypothetical protein
MTSRAAVGALQLQSRRALLRFLAGSPLAYAAGAGLGLERTLAQTPGILENPGDAVNVFDFHEHVKVSMLPGHYAYMSQGADDGRMLEVNREGFTHYKLRPRRLVDTTNLDISVELFGARYDSPIFLAPCASRRRRAGRTPPSTPRPQTTRRRRAGTPPRSSGSAPRSRRNAPCSSS